MAQDPEDELQDAVERQLDEHRDPLIQDTHKRTSRGTPVHDVNEQHRYGALHPSLSKYVKLIDERSQFRSPNRIVDATTGKRMEEGGPPSKGIRSRRNPEGDEGVEILTRKGILMKVMPQTARRIEERALAMMPSSPPVTKAEIEQSVMDIAARRMPEITALSWNYNGQTPPPIGYVPTTTAGGVQWKPGGGGFSGKVYVAGKQIVVTETTGFIFVNFDGSGYTHADTHDMSVQMEDDGEWYDLANTSGDIHLPTP